MPVKLGAKPQADFNEPLGLLSDCHRRIENFLGILTKVAMNRQAGEVLDEEHRRAVQTSLHYFHHAAPRHNADEEESLFPRLRQLSQTDQRVARTMDRLDQLEADHQTTNAGLDRVRQFFEQWLKEGTLAADQLQQLRELLQELQRLYAHHIELEDQQVFTLAGEVLGSDALAGIGREMARRRGL